MSEQQQQETQQQPDYEQMYESERAKREDAEARTAEFRQNEVKRKIAADVGLPEAWADRLEGDSEQELIEDAEGLLMELPGHQRGDVGMTDRFDLEPFAARAADVQRRADYDKDQYRRAENMLPDKVEAGIADAERTRQAQLAAIQQEAEETAQRIEESANRRLAMARKKREQARLKALGKPAALRLLQEQLASTPDHEIVEAARNAATPFYQTALLDLGIIELSKRDSEHLGDLQLLQDERDQEHVDAVRVEEQRLASVRSARQQWERLDPGAYIERMSAQYESDPEHIKAAVYGEDAAE